MTALAHPAKLAARARWLRLTGQPATAERLESELVAAGKCRRCGRALRDPESVRRGVGRDCWSKENRP